MSYVLYVKQTPYTQDIEKISVPLVFIAAVFAIDKTWKQLGVHQLMNG